MNDQTAHTAESAASAAKQRVARREQLRKEAAERGRLLPAEYRENIRRQFARDAGEARFIVGEHMGIRPDMSGDVS